MIFLPLTVAATVLSADWDPELQPAIARAPSKMPASPTKPICFLNTFVLLLQVA
jgi:hypothetical protein